MFPCKSCLLRFPASKRIAKECPDLPIFTIHDSIATTFGNEHYLATIITEEVKNLTDLDVQLGYEYWTP